MATFTCIQPQCLTTPCNKICKDSNGNPVNENGERIGCGGPNVRCANPNPAPVIQKASLEFNSYLPLALLLGAVLVVMYIISTQSK